MDCTSSKWEESPDSLWEICLNYCVNNPSVFSEYDEEKKVHVLREGVTFPPFVSESILNARRENGYVLDDAFLYIFKDPVRTVLKHICLRDSHVTDAALQWLLRHHPAELDISGCHSISEVETIHTINKYSSRLNSLFIGNNLKLLRNIEISDNHNGSGDGQQDGIQRIFGGNYVFDCPQLRVFSLHDLTEDEYQTHDIVATILAPFKHLTYLDMSGCDIELEFLEMLKNLTALILYNVSIFSISDAFSNIAKLKNLRALDIGQGQDAVVKYVEPETNIRQLVANLPRLTRLDISGTNLAGFIKPRVMSYKLEERDATMDDCPECPIPGLEGRRFDFLGLLRCAHDACHRENLPAKQVTGDANEDQTVLSVQVYLEKCDLLIKALNHLFHIMRFSECRDPRRALLAILVAMKRHPFDKHVQISGSASLFYIVKGEERQHFSMKINRKIISAILDGMENHMEESIMMRNGCLTLCHFKIPQDVIFDYKRLVSILLKMVSPSQGQDDFIQRIGIYLLNSLACQVDGKEKQMVGSLGAMQTMLAIIQQKLSSETCDEVMEIAWSTMWNVTDETAGNCERFLNSNGMDLFLACLETFSDKEELLRNMMGLMGNVAEVQYLRPWLMKSKYISVFTDLLDSKSDGIEVSYNACGVLAHLVSDGDEVWQCTAPPREVVMQKMLIAIRRWNLMTRRNINYRSFEPILRLLQKCDAPQAQHWAIWALCNLTKMYRNKYCPLVEQENGIALLQQLIRDPRPYDEVKQLARDVLDRCYRHNEDPDYDSSEEVNDEQQPMEG